MKTLNEPEAYADIKNNISILVISCDKYSDLWEPFFTLFWRFWSDCPLNVYLLTNARDFNHPQVKTILIGDDISWSQNLINAINFIKEDYVFLILDDLFLTDKIDSEKVMRLLKWALREKANYLRLNPVPKPDKPYNDLVGIVSRGTIYRASTVMTIFKKNLLLQLLNPSETAWDFEVFGTVRSDAYDHFYSSRARVIPFMNAVIKGKWQYSAMRKLPKMGVNIDFSKRGVMTVLETMKLYVKHLRSHVLNVFPAQYRRNIKDFIFKGKYHYKIGT